MRISELTLDGFCRHLHTKVELGDATYLIGENNVGKSSILRALSIMLSVQKNLDESDYYSYNNENGDGINRVNQVVITLKINDLPDGADKWRGFKGRVFSEESNGNITRFIIYRKTFPIGQSVKVEMKSRRFSYAEGVSGKEKTLGDFKDFEKLNEETRDDLLSELGVSEPNGVKLTAKNRDEYERIFDSYFPVREYSSETEWDLNPGGFQSNIISKLPRYLYIPAADGKEDLSQN